MIISTLVPHNYMMPFEVAKCWIRLAGFNFPFFCVEGPLIDMNRNKIFKYAVENEEDVLMIDADMVFTPDDVIKVRNHLRLGKDIVTGVSPAFIDNEPVAAIYKKKDDEYAFTEPITGEVDACGAAFLGISSRALKLLPPDPFLMTRENGKSYGEDLSFCRKVESSGIKIFCDASIRLSQTRLKVIKL